MHFSEVPPVDAKMMRASGVASENLFQKPEFQEYMRGHNLLAVFAKHSILNRITDVI